MRHLASAAGRDALKERTSHVMSLQMVGMYVADKDAAPRGEVTEVHKAACHTKQTDCFRIFTGIPEDTAAIMRRMCVKPSVRKAHPQRAEWRSF
jgi:hypothetical protein